MTSVDQRELDLPGVPTHPNELRRRAADREAYERYVDWTSDADGSREAEAAFNEWLAGGAE